MNVCTCFGAKKGIFHIVIPQFSIFLAFAAALTYYEPK